MLLSDDGEARLTLENGTQSMGLPTIVITMSNGGGFSSLWTNPEDALEIAEKIKNFVVKENNEGNFKYDSKGVEK